MAVAEETLPRPEAGPPPTDASSPGPSRPFLIALALFLLIIEAAAQFYLLPHHVAQAMDFRQLYTAGYMLRTEPAHLYDIERQVQMQDTLTGQKDGLLLFNHSPFEALFFLPLSYLPYAEAYRVMLAINSLLIGVCFFSLQSLFSATIAIWQPRPGLLFFPFVAVAIAVMHGQDSLLFLAICCVALNLILRDQDFLAGAILAATLFKPQITLPLVIILIVRRSRRFLAGFLTGSALILLLCLRVVHVSGLRAFAHVVAYTNAAGLHNVKLANGTSPLNMPNLHGLLYFGILRWLPHGFALPIMIFASMAVLVWAARRIREISNEQAAFAYALLWAVLLSYLVHFADLSLWIIAIPILLTKAKYPNQEFLLMQSAFLLPAALVFFVPDPNPWMWILSLPLLATALNLGRSPQNDPTTNVAIKSQPA